MSEAEGSQDGFEDAGSRSAQIRRALLPPIQSICSALGGYEDVEEDGALARVYRVGDECLTCLKDLKRFWRMDDDDDDRTVARIFAETNVLANDLLPILQVTIGTQSRGNKIALACADLIGAMTWPIDVVEELREAQMQDQQQQEKIDYSSLQAAHLAYKAAILRSGALTQLFRLLVPCLEKDRRERNERDQNIISLILHIVRNLAAIKDRPSSTQTSADTLELSTLQSELIVQLNSEHFFQLMLTIASKADGSEWGPWNMVTLDILHLLFRGVIPSDVASAVSKSKSEMQALGDLLTAERRVEKAEKRKTVSRHSRFGTTLSLTSGNRKYAMHQQAAISLSPSKVMDAIKKGKAKRGRQEDELAPSFRYRSDALVALRAFACAFVENSLNSFFLSVLKDIRLEREKTSETDNVRVLVLAAFFLDFFLLIQKQDKEAGIELAHEKGHNFELVSSLTDTQAIGYVMARMRLAREEKPPLWNELHASVECFTRILLTIDALSASPDEEQREIGMTLQNKLYYDAIHLDIILQVLAEYKNQSKRFLDAIVHLTYVLMRMLEKYSKNADAMYVRKKRKAKKTGADVDEMNGDDEPKMTFAEHAFRFEEYEETLANEHTLHTLMTYLAGYRTFTNEEQVKRLVNLMHRIAIKAKAEGIFFKVSVFNLFHRILNDAKVLPRQQAYQDLIKLIDHVLRRFFKVAQDRPLILLEIWYPHRKGEIKRMMRGENPAGADDDSEGEEPTLRLPAELEFKRVPEVTESKRIGIAVAAISDLNKEYLLDWVKDALRIAAAQREEIVYNTDGLPDEELPLDENGQEDADAIRAKRVPKGPSEEAIAKFVAYELPYADGDAVRAGTRDVHLKLLLRLLQWESTESADRLTWTIPANRLPADLAADVRIIDGFLINPVENDSGKAALDLLRRKKKPRTRRDSVDGDAEGGGDPDALSDGEEGGKAQKSKRRKKRQEELKSYKSAQFIEDSDDEDLDAFYKKEEELRERNKLGAGMPTASQMPKGKKQREKKVVKKRKRALTSTNGSDVEAATQEAPKGKRAKPKASKQRAADVTTSPSSPGSEERQRTSTPPSSLAKSSPASDGKRALSPPLTSTLPDGEESDGDAMATDEIPPSSGRFARKVEPTITKRARAVIADSDDD